jgi:hypothetical protein
MIIEKLLTSCPAFSEPPEINPLTDEDALQEVQLIDVRFDAISSSVGLLLELRNALQIRTANTGVLIARAVTRLSWSAAPRVTPRTAWNIIGSLPRHESHRFDLRLTMFPSAVLDLTAASASFYAGNVEGIGEAPPNYGDEQEVVQLGLPSWTASLSAIRAVSTPRADG